MGFVNIRVNLRYVLGCRYTQFNWLNKNTKKKTQRLIGGQILWFFCCCCLVWRSWTSHLFLPLLKREKEREEKLSKDRDQCGGAPTLIDPNHISSPVPAIPGQPIRGCGGGTGPSHLTKGAARRSGGSRQRKRGSGVKDVAKGRGTAFPPPWHSPRNLMRLNEAICVNESPAHPDVGFTPGWHYCKRQDSGPWGDIWWGVFSGAKLSSKIK